MTKMSPVLQSRRPLESPRPVHTKHAAVGNTDEAVVPHQDSIPHITAFPIRTIQPEVRTTFQNHQLRRKTPNGIVDAGYDASSKLENGEPPAKHLVLSATIAGPQTSILDPYHVSATDMLWSAHSLTQNPITNNTQIPWLNPFSPNTTTHFVEGPFQPTIRSNDYNMGAFCPMPQEVAFGQDQFHFGQIYENGPAPGPHDTSQLDQRSEYYPGISLQNPFLPTPIQAQPITKAVNPQSNIIGYQMQSAPAYSQPPDTQRHFKERALIQSYKRYMSLLAYIQATTRHNLGKDKIKTRFRHMVFPKPPKPYSPNSILSSIAPPPVSIPTNSSIVNHHKHHYSPQPPVQTQVGVFQHPWDAPKRDATLLRQPIFPGHGQLQTLQSTDCHLIPRTIAMQNEDDGEMLISDVRCSLEVIKTMCEQASWTWVDGMLLLGCMYHALEQFENALLWFARIINVNSSHVEAIANMGATFYCLQRHDEAEKQWLQAVSLQPSYLDAAEHLVGLLYKSRSQEAVNIIDGIQDTLKDKGNNTAASAFQLNNFDNPLINTRSQNDHGNTVSSPRGYTLPPEENGRMLALVHAKGTMLYGLKQTERAAAAFEEAIMISTGHTLDDTCDLIRHIRSKLHSALAVDSSTKAMQPLLLAPDQARRTAELAFGGNGTLPGLSQLLDPVQFKGAIQTTSNALLSLAKILQDAWAGGHSRVGLRRSPSGVGDILTLYYLSLSLQESPSTANNVGILLAGIQQPIDRVSKPASSRTIPTRIPGIAAGSGLELALLYYNYGLRLDPKHVHLHTNMGSLLKDVGQLDLAIQMYERAVACDGMFDIALTNLANAVKDKGRINEAIAYYKRAIAANPNFAEAVCGLFTALNSVCNWRGRGGAVLYHGLYDRWHVSDDGKLIDSASCHLASGLTKAVIDIIHKQLEGAAAWGVNTIRQPLISQIATYCQHLLTEASFDMLSALQAWAGLPWEGSRLVRLLERITRVAMRFAYRDLFVNRNSARHDWPRLKLPDDLSVPTAPTVLPFHTFTCPLSATDIRMISQRNALRISCSTLRASWLPPKLLPPPPPPSPHLNVGYVSSDFNNHPLAHLMQSVFGLHSSSRVRAHCYATTPSDKSAYRMQIEREAPCFRDVSSWSLDRIVNQISVDNIHILVNLNGYTRGARNEIFAARAAPLQMSFMGYAGTLGAEWCDYLLADSTSIPEKTLRPWRNNVAIEDVFRDDSEGTDGDWLYSENIIFCRDTFFCCDHAQSCAEGERGLSWADEERRRWEMRKRLFPSLADNTVILANFNQLYKIEPTVFRSWLRILAHLPNAILWLLRFPEAGEANLRQTALDWAGAEIAGRLHFTDVAPKGQHIARARVCDLFLDTPECNAHTTAADVLWSSTPLLTLPRYPYKMCSRMAASILKGALPKTTEGDVAAADLIQDNELAYENAAVRLASDLEYIQCPTADYFTCSGRLADIRKLLWANKWTCGLFDTKRWVSDLESAYELAWQRWVDGQGGDIYM